MREHITALHDSRCSPSNEQLESSTGSPTHHDSQRYNLLKGVNSYIFVEFWAGMSGFCCIVDIRLLNLVFEGV